METNNTAITRLITTTKPASQEIADLLTKRPPKGTFVGGGRVFPDTQLEEVLTAQLEGRPLPESRWK